MKLPLIGFAVDERFLNHRLKSTSLAGIVGGVFAICLFAYRFYISHFWSWDLFAVIAVILVIKIAAMIWFRLKD